MARTFVAIFACNEERRIAACIRSLPLKSDRFTFHLLVNGSADGTATVARAMTADVTSFHVHNLPIAGKARTWNHFVRTLWDGSSACVFVDGDTVVMPGTLDAMVDTLASSPHANAVNAMPVTGRRQSSYRAAITAEHGIFGALYGLSGSFLQRLKVANIWLPSDLIGDDGLIGALAKTDLGPEADWQNQRIANCPKAGFSFEEADWRVPATWMLQGRRMVSYSIRRYQNIVISRIMRGAGPSGLPATMRETYAANWHLFDVRARYAPFDLLAKRRMRQCAKL